MPQDADNAQLLCPVCGQSTIGSVTSDTTCPRCHSTFSADETRVVGESVHVPDVPAIPGYEKVTAIARGGMGMVLRAHHTTLNREVAIKIPLVNRADQMGKARFLREARSAAKLRHPNICPVYEVGEANGQPYIAMGFIEGPTLGSWAQLMHPNPRRAAEIVAELSQAVGYAHKHGVVHRDIKPSNVLVDSETSQPILTDFGLAKELDEQNPMVTRQGQVLGTPAYMAPEQAAGRGDQIGPHTDVYALGAILYDLLCGRPPFLGTSGEIIRCVQSEDVPSPRKYQPSLHRDIETICLKALARNPKDRYPTATELAEDLKRFTEGEAIFARRQSLSEKMWRKVRRNPVTSAIIFVAAVGTLLAGLAIFKAQSTRKVTELAQQLTVELEKNDWTPAHRARMEELIALLRQRSDEPTAAAAQERLAAQFAATIQKWIAQPRLETEDIRRIEEGILFLSQRTPALTTGLKQALHARVGSWQTVLDLAPPFQRSEDVFFQNNVKADDKSLARAIPENPRDKLPFLATRTSVGGPVQVEASFDEWADAQRLGLVLGERPDRGYMFLCQPVELTETPASPTAAPVDPSRFRLGSGTICLQILRNNSLLQKAIVNAADLPKGPLTLRISRIGNALSFQAANLPPLAFQDIFPLGQTKQEQRLGMIWPDKVSLLHLQLSTQSLPPSPSLLEKGDQLFAEGQFSEALAYYHEQAQSATQAAIRQEASFKEAMCLAKLNRRDDAAATFEKLMVEDGDRWPLLAGCQLWLLHIEQNRLDDAETVFESMAHRSRPENLMTLLPQDQRSKLLGRYSKSIGVGYYLYDAQRLRKIERTDQVERFLGVPMESRAGTKVHLVRALRTAGSLQTATEEADRTIKAVGLRTPIPILEEYCWLLREQGKAREAQNNIDRWIHQQVKTPEEKDTQNRLLLESSRIHIALEEWDLAEKDLQTLFEYKPNNLGFYYRYHAGSCLVYGFLLERRGDVEGAQKIWKKGLYENWIAEQHLEHNAMSLHGLDLIPHLIQASLTNTLTDAQAEDVLNRMVTELAPESPITMLKTAVHFPPGVLRQMWRSPRAKDYARQMAYQQLSFNEFIRVPAMVVLAEFVRQGAMGGKPTDDEETLLWESCQLGIDAYMSGKITTSQILPMALGWKGIASRLGWAGVAPTLPPDFRNHLTYFMGRRYMRLNKNDAAKQFFQAVTAEAPADSLETKLSRLQLEQLQAKAAQPSSQPTTREK